MAKKKTIPEELHSEFIEMYNDYDNYFVQEIASTFDVDRKVVVEVARQLGLRIREPGDHPEKKPTSKYERERRLSYAMHLITSTEEDTHYAANIEKLIERYSISKSWAEKIMAKAQRTLEHTMDFDRQAMARKNMREREILKEQAWDEGKLSVAASLLSQEARILKLEEVVVKVREDDAMDSVSIFLPDNGRSGNDE